jgi:adenylate kinase family enzyme
MKGLEFPIIGTKSADVTKKFDINSPAGRKEYFEAKAGAEISKIREFLQNRTFVANMVGKKNAGKGTYSKLFGEIFGMDKIAHISVGDLVRDSHANWVEFEKSPEFADLKNHYRGFISFDEAIERLHGRSQSSLLPTEFVLALLKFEISKHKGKSIFLDGLPREMDQISYALYFRDLINYREDPDLFILIDIPEAVIDERIKYRVICPNCKTSRSVKLLPTSKIGYDEDKKEFYLMCDNPDCGTNARMVGKEGDEQGIDPIRKRLEKDEEIMKLIFGIHGIPKVLIRNNVAVSEKDKYDDYEITSAFSYEKKGDEIITKESAWTFKDDNGVESVSLQASAAVVTMLKQLPEALRI